MNHRSYIDHDSWHCLLGKMSKNIIKTDIYASWTVNKTNHVVIFQTNNFSWIDQHVPCNFHYFSKQDIEILQSRFKVSKTQSPSVILDLEQTLNPVGKKYRGLRNRINRFENQEIEVLDDYKDFSDIEKFITEWRNEYSLKYFRDNSGKNRFFYFCDFHKNCINSFCYSGDKLVAIGTISNPKSGFSSYIVGKALYKENPVLSEFIDFSLYRKAYNVGARYVNMGFSSNKGLLQYKDKFPGLTHYNEFYGKIEGKNV